MVSDEQKVVQVEHIVCGGRMNVGGRWYFNGQRVLLNEQDAQILASRGATRPPRPTDKPAPGAAREKIAPERVGVQLKDEQAPANLPLDPNVKPSPLPPILPSSEPKPPEVPESTSAPTTSEPSKESRGKSEPTKESTRGKSGKQDR